MEKQRTYNSKKSSIEELFGNVLKQLRNEKGISQEELGFERGYHRTNILESGKPLGFYLEFAFQHFIDFFLFGLGKFSDFSYYIECRFTRCLDIRPTLIACGT